MICRAVVVGAYLALAIVVGVAYGGRGLFVLSFFYLWAGAWLVFILVWGRAARDAGRWSLRRRTAPPERDAIGSDSQDGLAAVIEEAGGRDESEPALVGSRRRPSPALTS